MQSPRIAKKILQEKRKFGGLTPPDFKSYHKATKKEDNVEWHKDKHIDQWNWIPSPELNPYVYGQIVFDKGNSILF